MSLGIDTIATPVDDSTKRRTGAKLSNMVQNIGIGLTMGAEAPGRVGKTRPEHLRVNHLLASRSVTWDRSGRGLSVADEPTEGALATFPRHYGREGGVCLEAVDLAVLIDPVTVERDALPRLPGSSRPKGPIGVAIHRYLLS